MTGALRDSSLEQRVVPSPGPLDQAAGRGAYAIQVVESCAPRQDFALNLIKRRLCCGVGACIGRTVEDCTAYRCAATAARSRASATTNLACLILASPDLFMICPQWSAGGLADHNEILPRITAISWCTPMR